MLFIPGTSAVNPLLYTAKNASTTGFHQDLAVAGDLTRTDASSVLDEWATSLNLTGPIVHHIRLKDLQSADSGMEEYLEAADNLQDLVVQLDVNDTDMATFEEENLANSWLLRDLLAQFRAYEALQGAEVVAREQKDVSGLKSVEQQGEDLRIQIRSDYEEYAARSGRITDISQKFGFDTSAFEQSVAEFAAILVDIDAEQVRRESSIPKTIQEITALDQGFEAGKFPSAISLKILPDHGVYGDTLSMAGTVDAPAGTGVRVFVDGRQIGNAATDQSGRFSLPYRIEQIEARAHTVYASVNPGISDVSTFTVGDGNTALSLTVRLIEENGTSKCIGTGRLVTDGGVPVRGARVDVDIDGRASWGYGITGDDGTYTSAPEQITPRTHTVKAKFRPDGYPLNGSESASTAIDVPSHFGWIAALVYLMGVGGAAVGGVLFLRKRQPIDAPSSTGTTVAAGPAVPSEPLPVPTFDEARSMADRATVTNEDRVDGRETIARFYRVLVRELEARNPGIRLRSRTPRDLAVLFADEPWSDQVAVLVGIHEKVRYAECEPMEDDLHRVREAFISIVTGGCKD